MVETSIPGVLRERASLQPNDPAFTYLDYDHDWDGVSTTLSWSELHRRVANLGGHLRQHGSTGDRALILAPQGLDYVLGFLAAIEAGLIPVPLSVPFGGAHDERTISVLADTAPTVVITTSAAIDNVIAAVQPQEGRPAPAIVEVDRLDLETRTKATGPRPRRTGGDPSDCIYLQYT
ncbi:MAG: AMP-binding protein, partial [Mycobacterium sp.]